jgi:hypothetical protein
MFNEKRRQNEDKQIPYSSLIPVHVSKSEGISLAHSRISNNYSTYYGGGVYIMEGFALLLRIISLPKTTIFCRVTTRWFGNRTATCPMGSVSSG